MQDMGRCKTTLPRLFGDENGQVLAWVALMILMLLGVAGMAVDVGHAYLAHRQLQASVNAVAIAAAEELPASDYATVGQAYGSASGEKNAYAALNASTPVVTGLCLTTVENWGIPCTSTNPNAVTVTETASVPTYFAKFVGFSTFNVGARATAAIGTPRPFNIAIVVDSTLSMDDADGGACGGITQMQCALNGVQTLLGGLSPTYDHVALFTFPNVAATASTAGVVNGGSYTCTTAFPAGQGYYDFDGSYTSVLTQPAGQMGTETPWSGAAWAMPYTFPPKPTSTSGYTLPTGTDAPTYEVAGFSTDYRTSATATTLNSSSNLVKAAGGDSGCGGIAPSNYDGNYGTYYAGAIYAAQAALLSEQTLNQGSMNAIIILGDGNSDAPNSSGSPDSASPSMSSTTAQITETYSATAPGNQASGSYTYPTATYPLANDSGTYPSWVGECGQAVAAASYASTYSGNKTEVFTVAYGSSTQSNRNNCNTDVNDGLTYSNISPCTTMKDMASEPDYFFSDYSVNGGDTGCQAPSGNNGSLNGIFETILAKLSGVRLIPDNTP